MTFSWLTQKAKSRKDIYIIKSVAMKAMEAMKEFVTGQKPCSSCHEIFLA